MPHRSFQVDLSGTATLVTGGASGIGLAAVEAFARCGARVALNHLADDARGPTEIERLRGQGYDVVGAPGDVSRPGEAEAMVTAAIDRLGRLDCLVANAGISGTREPIPLPELDRMTEEFWSAILATNLLGPFRCAHAAAAALKASNGAIVNTASIAGISSVGSSMAYGASKAALINLTRNLARALAPEVRVNAVAPGFVDTGWTRTWPAERTRGAIAATPLKRACKPEDIADAMLFLCVGTAMVTGQTLVVDGGLAL
jgi:3-oxoacyl-[acyl-carrier protein] reductase